MESKLTVKYRLTFLLLLVIYFNHLTNANAQQAVGSSCPTVGWTTIQPNQIVYCNTSNVWTLGEEITSTGYVGINTASPGSLLEVAGSNPLIELSNFGDYGIKTYWGASYGKLQLGMYNYTGSTLGSIPGGSQNTFFGFSETGAVGSMIGTFPNPSFRNLLDDGNGNVGIGGVSPAAKLDIDAGANQHIYLGQNAGYSGYNIVSLNGTLSDPGFIGIDGGGDSNLYVGSASTGSIILRPNGIGGGANAANVVTISGSQTVFMNGSVGIGTTAPQANLDITGYMKLAKYSSQPVACSSTNDGAIALTHGYTLCICNGSSTSWVQGGNGTNACSW